MSELRARDAERHRREAAMRGADERRRAKMLARCQRVAGKRGGSCLSEAYVRSREHLVWRCAEGHRWRATPDNVLNSGTWCPRCGGSTPHTLAHMQRAAKEKGGECLSESYVNLRAPLRWRCRDGHEWSARAGDLLSRGRWCPYCARQVPKTLEELKAFAAAHGGELLSKSPARNAHGKVRWRCKLGHTFAASENSVQSGRWCPKCRGRPLVDLRRLQATARRHNGRCLATKYEPSGAKVRWRCRVGHEWEALPNNVLGGQWCPTCAIEARIGVSWTKLTLADVQETARARGGECISDEYINATTKLRWRCASGHEWEQTPGAVRYGTWCPVCAKRYRGSVEGLSFLASERGGRCLSERYDGRRMPVRFECRNRHRFELTSVAAKSGAWCPVCPRDEGGATRD